MAHLSRIKLSGLTCTACEKLVSKRLHTIEGVEQVVVSSPDGQVSISASRPISENEVSLALAGTQYEVITNL